MDAPNDSALVLRRLRPDEWDAVARLIFESTNTWYREKLNREIFATDPLVARVFPEVYEALDPGCCVVAECARSGAMAGSCFYHPRETHVSLGIMNVHPDFYGRGVARRILAEIIGIAEARGHAVRLVSSALNLDSFSLYTRAGFVPRVTFQDMTMTVPKEGLRFDPPGHERVRAARPEDAVAMADLERSLCGIRREKDFRHFLENAAGIWHVSVLESADGTGALDGFLCSVGHPGSNIVGPGVMRTEADGIALLHAELNVRRGRSPVFIVPVQATEMVRAAYAWGARNCEMHLLQVRGDFPPITGITMPSFMPETA